VVDNLLNRGVVVNADVVLALGGVDLVYLRASVLLCAADRIFHAADDADDAGRAESTRRRRPRRGRRL
jgi:hypothetical protein